MSSQLLGQLVSRCSNRNVMLQKESSGMMDLCMGLTPPYMLPLYQLPKALWSSPSSYSKLVSHRLKANNLTQILALETMTNTAFSLNTPPTTTSLATTTHPQI